MSILNNLSVGHIEFESTRRATVFAHAAGDRQRGFLTQRFQRVPDFRGHGVLCHDALDDARAVAKLWKHQLAARTHVIEPALQRDFIADVFL